jgi:hypothetical protein
MDYLALIKEARAAGLDFEVQGETLIVDGPEVAAPIVRRIRDAKAGVICALKAELGEPVGPPWPCSHCKTQNWRAIAGRHTVCGTCYDRGAVLMAGRK